MTISNKGFCFGAMLGIAITGTTPALAVSCGGFATLMTSMQASMGEYADVLKKDKNASEREICGVMRRLFEEADILFKNDYSVCTPKKVEYAALLKEINASVQDYKGNDFQHFRCSRFQ
jgi:hypothetical protein